MTPSKLKKQFAKNFDFLLKITCLSRKQAAEEMDISYKLVRRLASAGVSRIDNRNKENLSKIASFFSIQIEDFWIENFVELILRSDRGKHFVSRFHEELKCYQNKQSGKIEEIDQFQLQLVSDALANEVQSDDEMVLNQVRVILKSDRAEQFKCLINDYCELAK